MEIKPDEIASILRERIEGMDTASADLTEVGTVLSVADGNPQQVPGALHRVALDDLVPLAEEHGADVVRLEVEGEAGDSVRQLQHLQRHAVVEAVDAGDAVGDGQHGADL